MATRSIVADQSAARAEAQAPVDRRKAVVAWDYSSVPDDQTTTEDIVAITLVALSPLRRLFKQYGWALNHDETVGSLIERLAGMATSPVARCANRSLGKGADVPESMQGRTVGSVMQQVLGTDMTARDRNAYARKRLAAIKPD